MNLRYMADVAHVDFHIVKHPEKVLKELGITYEYAKPVAIASQWWLYNCQNVPVPLPGYIKELGFTPGESIEMGIPPEIANNLKGIK